MSDAQVSAARGYREYLRARMHVGRESQRGMMAELARAARVHPTMITHVFKGEAELSPEQAIRVAAHLGLNEEETDRLLTMVMLERAGTEEARRFFRRRLERADSRNGERLRLFSDWLPAALMLLLGGTGGGTAAGLAARAHVDVGRVERALILLEAHGYCRREGETWLRVEELRAADEAERELSRCVWRDLASARQEGGFSLAGPVLCSEERARDFRRLVEGWLADSGRAGQEGAVRALAISLIPL